MTTATTGEFMPLLDAVRATLRQRRIATGLIAGAWWLALSALALGVAHRWIAGGRIGVRRDA